MATEDGRVVDLFDDTRLNVASLLMEPVGSMRDVEIHLPVFVLDDDLVARDVETKARLTRLRGEILVAAHSHGNVQLACARCLTDYDQPFEETFTDQFFQTVDVRSGSGLKPDAVTELVDDDGEVRFFISESHELDLAESLRQWILLSLPMRPHCGDDCEGPLLTTTEVSGPTDSRFAGLASLLEDIETERS